MRLVQVTVNYPLWMFLLKWNYNPQIKQMVQKIPQILQEKKEQQ